MAKERMIRDENDEENDAKDRERMFGGGFDPVCGDRDSFGTGSGK
jgi:hypothetical protein